MQVGLIYGKGVDESGLEDRAYRCAGCCLLVSPAEQTSKRSICAGYTTTRARTAQTASLGACSLPRLLLLPLASWQQVMHAGPAMPWEL